MASLTNRYTQALFEVAQAEQSTDRVAEDLHILGIALADRGLRLLLENPEIKKDRKADLLAAVLRVGGREPHTRTLSFLEVLLARGRQGILSRIVHAFRARALDARGEVEGVLETARELDPTDVEALQSSLSSRVGRRVLLEARVLEDLLGGFRVRVADSMFDASLSGQLDALGRRLKGIPIATLRDAARG